MGRTSLGLAAVLLVVAAGLGAVSSLVPKAAPPATPATNPPYSARWVCPLLPKQASSVAVANLGGAAATLRTTVTTGSTSKEPSQRPLDAGTTRNLEVAAADKAGYAQVEAFTAPSAVSATDVPGCAPGPNDRWWIPAADTSLGASTTVVVANPDGDAAVVDLIPHVNQGSFQSVEQLFVPPRSAVSKQFSYGKLVGLKPTIEVIAKSGRVVAGAVVAYKDKQRAYLPGQTTARPVWSFAGGLAGQGRRTEVVITNPSASPLSVTVQVSTDRGTFKPGDEFDKPIPAGAATAISIPPLRIGGSGAFAVQVRSRDGAQFLAALRVTTPTSSGTATFLDLGSTGTNSSWLVPAVPASKRLVLANLGTDTLSARLAAPGSSDGDGDPVNIGPGKVVVREVPAKLKNVRVSAEQPGLLVAPLGGGAAVFGADIGGLSAGGPVMPGPAAA